MTDDTRTVDPMTWIDTDYDRPYPIAPYTSHTIDGPITGPRFDGHILRSQREFTGILTDPLMFTRHCWVLCTDPVMTPPYVHLRRDVHSLLLSPAPESDTRMIAEVTTRLWHYELAPSTARELLTRNVGDWRHDRAYPTLRGMPSWHINATVLTSAVIRVPIPRDELHEPRASAERGQVDPQDARSALTRLVALLNRYALPLLNAVHA